MAETFGSRMMLKINVGCFAFSVGNESRKHSAPYVAKTKCRMFAFTVGNESRKHSAPYER